MSTRRWRVYERSRLVARVSLVLLSRVGVWCGGDWLRPERRAALIAMAVEIEALGYASLWISADFGDSVPAVYGEILEATRSLRVAPGIVSIWHATPRQTSTATRELSERFPGRFWAGLGASHERFVTREPYEKPYSAMCRYLDALDLEGLGADGRILAALGPRMIELAGQRSLGAHPYLVPVEHTVRAREILGTGPLLIPELGVVMVDDPQRARQIARDFMALYLELPNYVRNLGRLGFSERDIRDGGSDRLVDALIAWGRPEAVVGRVVDHLDAGADEVLVQVLTGAADAPTAELRNLADALR